MIGPGVPEARLVLHDTASRRKLPFRPLDPERVRLYVCGPTVYQRIHVGNARPLVVFDVLFRLLRHVYGADAAVYARNITDIDDRIIAQAAEEGVGIEVLTERTTAGFRADCAALGCLEPTFEPRATQHIPAMLTLVERLLAKGHAYTAQGHVLFAVASMPAYGSLSGRDREQQVAGSRVEVAPYKRDPADFVLWKPSTPGQPGWASPWGRGRPGWHLECSAMSEALLGPLPIDLHGGGQDLIFPHHENENAQSCCAADIPRMARIWLHNGFVDMAGLKMSKSLGNVVRVDEALALAPGEALRLLLLQAHYRQPMSFDGQALDEARRTLDRLYGALARAGGDAAAAEPDAELLAALSDDLNTPAALARLHELLGELNRAKFADAPGLAATLRASAGLLGLLQAEPTAWLQGAADDGAALAPAAIEAQVAARLEARRTRDFARADAIRAELAAAGVLLEDGPSGTTWRRG